MIELIGTLTLIFVVAAVLLLAAPKLSLPVIPLYLLTGVLVGAFIDEAQLLDLAQWGVAFLVFLFGIRVDLETIVETGRVGVVVAAVQAVAVGSVAFLAGLAFGLESLNAFYLCVAAALSSSLVSSSYLDPVADFYTTSQRLSDSIHFVEDLIGVGVLVGLAAVVYATENSILVLLTVSGLFAAAIAVRRLIFPRLATRFQGDAEVMMLIGISFIVSGIAVAEAVGVSIAVGAFAAGVAISDEYPYSLELVDTIDDLTDFFVPIFFVTVGALITVPDLLTLTYTGLLLVTVLVVNPLLTILLLVWRGFSDRAATLTGARLDQVSEFSLIIAVEALIIGTIARDVFDAIVLAALLTMLVAAYTSEHDEAIYRRIAGVLPGTSMIGEQRTDAVRSGHENHVVIVGFEDVGRVLFEHCLEHGRDCVVIVDNPVHAATVDEMGGEFVVGDPLDPAVRESAEIATAGMIISTLPQHDLNCEIAGLETEAPLVVVGYYRDRASELYDAGADYVTVPDVEARDRIADRIEATLIGEIDRTEFRNLVETDVEREK